MLSTLDVQLVFKFSGQNFEDDISKFEWILAGKGDVHKSQNCNFRSGLYVRSTVRLFDANNNFKMTIGPSMNAIRRNPACGIYHSSIHSGRPVIVTAGGVSGVGVQTAEIWDFTKPGSQWQLSKYFGLIECYQNFHLSTYTFIQSYTLISFKEAGHNCT